MLSSYQFAGNTPIWAIDLDGLEPKLKTSYENASVSALTVYEAKRLIYDQKWLTTRLFKLAFSHYLPKKFIDHFAYGNGNMYRLSSKEMADFHPFHIGIQGNLSIDKIKFNKFLESIENGETKSLPENYTIANGSHVAGTLGGYTVRLKGDITKNEDGSWSFKGQMQFYDEWDFDTNERPTGDYKRSDVGNKETEIAKEYLKGNSFKIESDWVNVSQNSSDKGLDWFSGKSEESVQNRKNNLINFGNKIKKKE